MGWLSLALANWRWIGAGLLCVGLVAGGYYVKAKFVRAAEADALEQTLKAERTAHTQSEAARIRSAGNLAAQSDKVRVVIKEVIRRVPQLVHDDRACDFNGELTGVLNRARGYDVPGAGRPAAPGAGAAAAPP